MAKPKKKKVELQPHTKNRALGVGGGKHVYKRGKNTLETMIDRQMQ